MKHERIFSYQQSKVLTQEEAQSVSAAGTTTYCTANGSYQGGHYDGALDVTIDL